MPDQADIERFIASTFRSVWDLELLLELTRSPGDRITRDQLVTALRASDVVVSRGVETLVAAGLAAEDSHGSLYYAPAGAGLDGLAAGLITQEKDGSVRYRPASAELADDVKGAVDLYGAKPDSVRRLIVLASSSGLAAFSDAFRFKGDK